MGRYAIIRAVAVALVTGSFLGGGAAHAEVVLGASLGYTHVSYPDVPHVTNDVVGIPSRELWSQPGIRVGYLAPGGRWDLNADVGLERNSSSVGTVTTFELLPQVQVNAPGRGGFSAFVNAGVGVEHETMPIVGSVSETRPAFGAGLGVRKSVSDGHGLVRVELRYDHLPKVEKVLSPSNTAVFFARDMFSVKLGFDLLVAR